MGARVEMGFDSGGWWMLYSLARFLQLLGLVLLPLALAGNMAEKLDLQQMLGLSGAGIGAFAVGWLLQQVARPK